MRAVPITKFTGRLQAATGRGGGRLVGMGLWLFLAVTMAQAGTDAPSVRSEARDSQPASQALVEEPFSGLPWVFVANGGQLDSRIRFSARRGDQSVAVGAGRVWLRGGSSTANMTFVGASPTVRLEGRDRLSGVVNVYRGRDPQRWVEAVPTFGAVAQVNLYPSITHLYLSADGELKSELRVEPGGDPSLIRMAYEGVEALSIDEQGALIARTADGEWRESAPVVFQYIDGRRVDVSADFELLGELEVGFRLAPHDPEHELIIDPSLYFSTYLGGSNGDESGTGIAVDDQGNVVVCGSTESTDFPLENEVSSPQSGNYDPFFAKLDPTGSSLIFSTYLGGSSREIGGDVAVDREGNSYCLGWTSSSNFPTTAGVLQPAYGGGGDDAALVKLDPSGALVYATYLGAGGDDQPVDVAVDADGFAYLLGHTGSSSFPTTTGPAFGGVWDVFVAKLDAAASSLIYSTFLGGSGYEEPRGLALDAAGNAYVVGRTQSSNFPTTPGAYDTTYNGTDTTFLTKVSPAGDSWVYSTFLDGISPRFGASQMDVAVDAGGYAYVALPTEGSGYPATAGAFDTSYNGGQDAVVLKMPPDGAGPLVYSTFLGGALDDAPRGIVVGADGTAYVTGFTDSADFPTVDPKQATPAGARDIFVSQLSPDGSALTRSTYLGGTGNEGGNDIALGVEGPCITGGSSSTDYPTTAPSPFSPFQDTFGGGTRDAIVTCLDTPFTSDPCLPPPPDMVFWAPFDEAAGPVAADLVAGNNGAYMGSAMPTGGKVDRGIDLDGGHVVVSDSPDLDFGTGDFSIDFWIEQASYPPLGGVVAKYDTQSNQGFEVFWDICLCIPSAAVLAVLVNGTYNYLPFGINESDPLPWTHIVIVVRRAAQEIDLYVDGVYYGPTALTLAPGASVDNDEPLVIGQGVHVVSDFSGKLDELELFDRALSATEALELYAADEDGKCKDGLGVPWDKPFCRNASSVVVPVEVCNHSTVARSYELTFAPLPTGPHCSVAGPTDFEDGSTAAPPPLSLLVPAQSCLIQPVRIDRPSGLVAHNQVACYQVIRQDLSSGETLVKSGSVQDKRNECWTVFEPPGWEAATQTYFLVQPAGEGNGLVFDLANTTESEMTVRYRIEAMPGRVLLNGQEAGIAVEGAETVPAEGVVPITVSLDNLASQAFEYDDIILSTDSDGSGNYVALAAVAARPPLPTETVVANPDSRAIQNGAVVTLDVLSNDFSSAGGFDLETLAVIVAPAEGSATAHGDGTLTYEAPAGFVGTDVFVYEICDTTEVCDSAAVRLTIGELTTLFGDGFESGDVSAWSSSVP